MSKNLFIKISALVILLSASSSQARVGSEFLNGIFRYIKPGQEFYSPALGQLAIESGFIENLRFFGNIKQAFEEGPAHERRSYIKDEGQDAISRLVIQLFPSNGGALTVESLGQDNFGKYVLDPRIISILLNHAADCRKISSRCEDSAPKEMEIRQLTGITSSKKKALESLREIIGNISLAIKEETSGIYPAHITELILLAFFFEKFDNQADIWHFLSGLDDAIVDKEKMRTLGPPLPLKEADITTIMSKESASLTLDDIINLKNSSVFYEITPYKPGVSLLSNAQACAYDRRADQSVGATFADCIEMAGRHVMNLLLYNPDTKIFDLKYLNNNLAHVADKHPFKNFQRFYDMQIPSMANAGYPKIRSLWNQVVGDLSLGEKFSFGILYCEDEQGQCAYNLEAGLINFVNVFAKIFGIEVKPLPDNWELSLGVSWLQKYLTQIFTAINPKRIYQIDVAQVRAKELSQTKELSGNVKITVNDDSRKLFSFELFINAGAHGEVRNLTSAKDFSSIRDKITRAVANYPDFDVLTLLLNNHSNNPNIYNLFNGNLKDNGAKIRLLTVLNNTLKINTKWLNKYNLPVISRILENILQDVSWSDHFTVEKLSPQIVYLAHSDLFPITTFDKVRSLNISIDSSQALGLFTNLQHLGIEGSIKSIELRDLPNLVSLDLRRALSLKKLYLGNLPKLSTLNLEGTNLENVALNRLPGLSELNLNTTYKLRTLALTEVPNLERLSLRESQVQQIDGLNKLANLIALDLSRTRIYIPSLAGLSKLVDLDLARSDITGLEINELLELTHLNLSGTKSLKKLVLSNLLKLKVINLNESEVAMVNLSGLSELVEIELKKTHSLENLLLGGLINLKTIAISQSSIKSLNFDYLPQLSELNLSSTVKLEKLSLANARKLKIINLNASAVKMIEGLNELSELEELDLGFTEMDSISLVGLNLKRINFERAAIKFIELDHLPELMSLDVSGNRFLEVLRLSDLKKLYFAFFSNLPALKSLHLRGLPAFSKLDMQYMPGRSYSPGLENVELRDLPSLTSINLQYNYSLLKLSLSGLPQLKKLLAPKGIKIDGLDQIRTNPGFDNSDF